LNDEQIVGAIADAEKRTSGEIRVFVSERAVDNPIEAAEKEFVRMGMTKTAQRNGVLVFFAPKSQKYAVVGDQGVHQRCGQGFWEHITEDMTPLLRAGKFTEAVVHAVHEIGNTLAKEFPPIFGDKNELPNRVERG
jgi:uncharacterized membrane protein